MTREKYCCRFSLVHRTWTVAAQTVLWSEVMLWDPKRIKLAIDSPALGRHSVKRLTLMGGRGTRVRKARSDITDWPIGGSQRLKL